MEKPNRENYYKEMEYFSGGTGRYFDNYSYEYDLEKYINYLESKVNNSVLDDVKVCDRCDGKGNVWYFPDESNFHTEIPCPKCRS